MRTVLLPALAVVGCAATGPADDRAPASRPAPKRIVAYRPGVRIDWTERQVELDAEVVLREGALELLVCLRGTKDYESILRVPARPLHIYEAMGLLGLAPGEPAGWDEKNQRVIPPTGEKLDLRIRYRQGGREKTVGAHAWLWDANRKRPMPATHWIFAGSQRLSDGTFFADLDGTVVTVVDFSSALITVPGSHSDDNAELWLEPYTANVPKEGTRCVLLIRKAKRQARTQPAATTQPARSDLTKIQ